MDKLALEFTITAEAEVITAAEKLAILHREATEALGAREMMSPRDVLKIIEEGKL